MSEAVAPPVWRVDAILCSSAVAVTVVAVAVLSSQTITHSQNILGTGGEELARSLLNTLGMSLAVLLSGTLALFLHYAARGGPIRLMLRIIGWTTLTVVAAGLLDLGNGFSSWPVSAYGPAGSVGAYVRHFAERRLPEPLPVVSFLALGLLGLTLAMDGFVRQVASLTLVAAHWVNGQAMSAVTSLCHWWKARQTQVMEIPAPEPQAEISLRLILPDSEEPPIIRHTAEIPDLPEPEPEVEDNSPSIPIHRPTVPAPNLKLHAHEEPEPEPAEDYELPSLSLLADPDPFPVEDHEVKLRERAALLEKTFTDFGLTIKVVGIHTGPVITQYEVSLDTGLRLNKVTTLADDLALNLGVSAVRIVAPLPGRNTVGIEVPNDHRQTVRLKELIQATNGKAAKFKLPIFLGKDVEGRPLAERGRGSQSA
jgi:DNA segregation ATPase FtsK/SpoIIIE, S-DNA-T family